MTDTLMVLGQNNPSAITLTNLYTVPTATSATVSSITVCNSNGVAATFRVSIAINGAADTLAQYIYYDLPLDGNDTFIATVGFTLAAGDVVRVYASNTNLAFSIFGVQIT